MYIETIFCTPSQSYTRTQIMPYKDTKRESARTQGTYDVYIEIDIDCQELLDACDIDYKESDDDMSQNEVAFHLDRAEYIDVFDQSVLSMTNEQTLAAAVLNHELSEYTTKATIYTPSGDRICFS